MKKGDIRVVEVPGVDGHEQKGLRPAIVLADARASVVIIISPFGSNPQK